MCFVWDKQTRYVFEPSVKLVWSDIIWAVIDLTIVLRAHQGPIHILRVRVRLLSYRYRY